MLGDLEGPCTPGDSSVAAQPRLLSPGLHRTPYKPEVQMGALRRVYRLTYSFRCPGVWPQARVGGGGAGTSAALVGLQLSPLCEQRVHPPPPNDPGLLDPGGNRAPDL